MRNRLILATVGALGAIVACTDEATPPLTGPASAFDITSVQVRDVRGVDIDLPPEVRPWDTSAVALEAAIAAEDGYASVGFKARSSERALVNGRREAVSRTDIEEGVRLLAREGVEVLRYWAFMGAVFARLPSGAATVLRDDPLIDYIEPRQWYTADALPLRAPRTALAPSPAQSTPWGIVLVRAPDAWSVATGDGARIQIIDTGHDRGHEDLPLVPTNNCAGSYGGCDDESELPHGTFVLGVFTARDNSIGTLGVAPGVDASDVYVYGACYWSDYYHTDVCSEDAIISGIEASVWSDVLNLSLGSSDYSQDMATAIAQAWADSVVIVAAAGNRQDYQNPPAHYYPAEYTNVIGVSGVRSDGTFASSSPCGDGASNYGAWVDLAAPFWTYSTVMDDGYEDEEDGWCGTSISAPHVAGAAAILREQHPDWSHQQIVNRLLATAVDAGDEGRDDYYGEGLLDVAAAVGILPLEVTIDGPTLIRPGAECTWTADVSGGVTPYSFFWSGEIHPWGTTGQYYTGGKDSGVTGNHFKIRVDVSDDGTGSTMAEITVTENANAPICFQ